MVRMRCFFSTFGAAALSHENLYLHLHLHFPVGVFVNLYCNSTRYTHVSQEPWIWIGAYPEMLGVHLKGYYRRFGNDLHDLFRERKAQLENLVINHDWTSTAGYQPCGTVGRCSQSDRDLTMRMTLIGPRQTMNVVVSLPECSATPSAC